MSSFDTEFAAEVVPDQFDLFGRTVTFHPDGGDPRSVEMIFTPLEQEIEQEEFRSREREEIWVEVRRDQSHAKGGIAQPRMNDWFNHPDESTDDPTPFTYQGRKRNVNPTTFELLFARPTFAGQGLVSRQ